MNWSKPGRSRWRKGRTLALLLVFVALYFILQFFYLSKLNSFSRRSLRYPREVEINYQVNHTLLEKVNGIPRGVHPSYASLYSTDKNGLFKCLKSEVWIPESQVNDDFCDCPDFSDEPGTSACPDSRFYCNIQLPHREPQFLHSSKVNDGICDCCDGSDEWSGKVVPDIMNLKGKSGAVFHSPCQNHCGNIMQLIEDEKRISSMGALLKKKYLESAMTLSKNEKKKYGPEGVFYLLHQSCFEYSSNDYKYTICPFDSVKQSKVYSQSATILGRSGLWTQLKQGDYLLSMGQGDASLCPDGQPRETKLHFLCGLEDRVISVHEDQKCQYFVKISTPAAC